MKKTIKTEFDIGEYVYTKYKDNIISGKIMDIFCNSLFAEETKVYYVINFEPKVNDITPFNHIEECNVYREYEPLKEKMVQDYKDNIKIIESI